jgi:hypothetical protein
MSGGGWCAGKRRRAGLLEPGGCSFLSATPEATPGTIPETTPESDWAPAQARTLTIRSRKAQGCRALSRTSETGSVHGFSAVKGDPVLIGCQKGRQNGSQNGAQNGRGIYATSFSEPRSARRRAAAANSAASSSAAFASWADVSSSSLGGSSPISSSSIGRRSGTSSPATRDGSESGNQLSGPAEGLLRTNRRCRR